LSAAEIAVEAIAAAAAAFFTFGASEIAFAAEVAANVICLALAAAATIEAAVSHFL
jgi:chitinase